MNQFYNTAKCHSSRICLLTGKYTFQADVKKYEGRYAIGWDQLRRRRYAKQVELGIIDLQHKLSPRPDYIPAWDQLTKDERAWEEDRMEVFAAMVDCVDQNIGRLVNHLKQ